MSDLIRVKTRSIEDLRRWIITQGQFSTCGTELLQCLMHIDYLKASQPSAMILEQTTLGVAEALPPSDGEIEEWADQSDLIPDEQLVCDEQWQRCFLPEQFYATIRAALARWGSLAGTLIYQPAPPPAPAPIDIDALLSPEGAYEPGTGQEDGAQLVDQLEWWAPLYGCETLDNLLDRLRARILPYLRPPIAGIDVPGCDGDYGDVMDLCAAEGVDVRIGAPLLRRARDAWKVAAQPPAPYVRPLVIEAGDAQQDYRSWLTYFEVGGNCGGGAKLSQENCRSLAALLRSLSPTLLRQPAPAVVPVAVAERLPQAEDCSFNPGAEIGSCWCWNPPTYAGGSGWWSFEPLEWAEDATHWLPAYAIPQPPHDGEVQP